MKHFAIAFLILFIALQGCNKQDNDSQLTTLNLTGKLSDETFDLSKHVIDVKMVRLETNESSYIQDFRGHVGEKYIINIDMNKVILFSSVGEYIKTIMKKGRGLQEFTNIDAWAVDENENRFLFHDRNKNFIFNH